MSEAISVLDLVGHPRDRGRIHGESLRPMIRELLELERGNWARSTGSTAESFSILAEKYGAPLEQFAPALLDEMKGIAEGATLSLGEVLGLNCFLDFYDMRVPANYRRLVEGCTAFGVNAELTSEGHAYIAQTYDLAQHFERYAVLLRIAHSDNSTSLVYSFAGVLACAGLNSHGVGVLINKLTPTDGKQGVCYPAIVRQLLTQRRLGDAIGTIIGADRASGVNYLLADPVQVIDIETTANEFEVLYPTDGYIRHTNHYVSDFLKPLGAELALITADPSFAHTYTRYARIGQLIANCKSGRAVEICHLLRMARDHENHPFSICMHAFELSPQFEGKTIATIILDPALKELSLALGNPCESRLTKHEVKARP